MIAILPLLEEPLEDEPELEPELELELELDDDELPQAVTKTRAAELPDDGRHDSRIPNPHPLLQSISDVRTAPGEAHDGPLTVLATRARE